ncbi:hypothetical protein Nepgr_012985 [Nepenthes gracilis]|uniref:Uncharacterized protein n=1 Tax=Nepenthes gracilis TaxID=150966 RepID=A0AAD3XNP5_NEPGR|nr:hypothetical protein Nepgr_012985 [Nepenthes gracilis]
MKWGGCQGTGEKVVRERKVLNVIVEKGMQHGQKITFPGQAYEVPDTITGHLLIKSNPGVVKPDQFKAVGDEGLPMYQSPFLRGKLYIHFTVELLRCWRLLPSNSSLQLTDMELGECEETTLHYIDANDLLRKQQSQSQQEAYEEDNEPRGAQRVQCGQH